MKIWPIIIRDVRKEQFRDALMRLNQQLAELEAILERRRRTEEKLSELHRDFRSAGVGDEGRTP
jgi:hypothetical protein